PDVWSRALELRKRSNVIYLDLGAMNAGDPSLSQYPHHRVQVGMLDSLEKMLDILRTELSIERPHLTLTPLSLEGRYVSNLTHGVQLANEGGVFERGVYDSQAAAFRLYPHCAAFVETAKEQVVKALSVLSDEDRHRLFAVGLALQKASIRFHDQ